MPDLHATTSTSATPQAWRSLWRCVGDHSDGAEGLKRTRICCRPWRCCAGRCLPDCMLRTSLQRSLAKRPPVVFIRPSRPRLSLMRANDGAVANLAHVAEGLSGLPWLPQ